MENSKIQISRTRRTFHKQQIWQTNDLSQTSSFSFVKKLHIQIPIMVPKFRDCKKQVLIWIHFVWTTFVNCLRSNKTVCLMQLYDLWFTHPLKKLPNFSFDSQRQLLDLISFCDARFSVQVCAIVRPVNEASAENVFRRTRKMKCLARTTDKQCCFNRFHWTSSNFALQFDVSWQQFSFVTWFNYANLAVEIFLHI